ncbi:LPXTG cell wall anchor domain-containing protein [Enterococcus innesii]|uniref:LPXTG cell wall anchor domain-containing protein n=1 Tax=Enterococcus innesii TaxID=2839759 RepID=UPI0034A3151D
MKKILFLSLFSTTILLGTAGVTASAEEATTDSSPAVEIPSDPVVPSEPTSTTPSVEPPTDPVVPPASGGESQPTVPDTPEVPVTPPSEPSGGETVPTTPTDPGTSAMETPGSTTGSSTTEQPTTPSTSEEPETPTEESTQPAENQPTEKTKEDKETKPKEDKTAAPAKEVTVLVDPSGKIMAGTSQGTSVPIVTSDVKEISHIPTPTTPLKAASGQTIVGVKDGVPLVQDAQGNLVEDPSIPVKKLPSGNIEVKTADGKTKVLPKTGEEVKVALSVLGTILTSIAGFFLARRDFFKLSSDR